MRMVFLALLLCMNSASAQPYPAKTVRIIVPNAAGGPSDLVGRLMAQKFSEAWGHPVVVENRVGAGGNIGADAVAKAPPDGYTLLVTNSAPIAINASVYANMPYDPIRDFAPVSLLASIPFGLAVPASSPANSVAELIQYVKGNPGRLNFASVGGGSGPHLAGELFKVQSGIDIVHVPYRSVPLALAALMNNEVAMLTVSIDSLLPQAKAGRIKLLAVTSKSRSALAPEIPTIAASGLPDYEVTGWYGILAPAGTPKEIVARVHAETLRVLAQSDVRQKMAALGFDVVGNTPLEFATHIAAESARWSSVAKAIALRIE